MHSAFLCQLCVFLLQEQSAATSSTEQQVSSLTSQLEETQRMLEERITTTLEQESTISELTAQLQDSTLKLGVRV